MLYYLFVTVTGKTDLGERTLTLRTVTVAVANALNVVNELNVANAVNVVNEELIVATEVTVEIEVSEENVEMDDRLQIDQVVVHEDHEKLLMTGAENESLTDNLDLIRRKKITFFKFLFLVKKRPEEFGKLRNLIENCN